jgi:hypothetical protein
MKRLSPSRTSPTPARSFPGGTWDWVAWSALAASAMSLAWVSDASFLPAALAISGFAFLAKGHAERKEAAPAFARVRVQAPRGREPQR